VENHERKVAIMTIDSNGKHVCDLLCPVRHLMRGVPPFVDPEDTLRSAAQGMAGQKAGAVIVLGPDGPTSIVTERDIVRALADHADPDTVWAADVASSDLAAIDPETTLAEAVELMAKRQIRHVPVKSNGEVMGMIEAEDILDLLGSAALRGQVA
jgi:signal-transduction protein with cAMP-binding, CBS, and nucleotidyltransferase domain